MRGTIVYKMTGSGNDFVLLDGRSTDPEEWPPARVVQLCDRRLGVGADGLVLLAPETPGSVRMAFWNSDGSRAAMCGNAALCSARLAVHLELVEPGELCLLTDAGVIRARCMPDSDRAEIQLPDVELSASVPAFDPVAGRAMDRPSPPSACRTSSLVWTTSRRIDLVGRGRSLRYDRRLGPAGANVNFVAEPHRVGEPWLIRTYERGVEGETLACGTGTVASGVALAARGESALPVRFTSRGGEELQVRADLSGRSASDVWLGGQGKLVFRAVWEG